jgi:hypothetical protein
MKSSLHRLIPFLSLFCNCQVNSIPLFPSWYHGRLASPNSIWLDCDFSNEHFFILILQGPRRKHGLSIVGKECLQRRCIATEINCCLHIRCLAMNVYSDFTISAFGRYVTILLPSPRRYSSGWALASWTICLHSSPAEADCLVSEQFSFYGVRLLVSRPTPNREDQGISLRLAPTPWPVRHRWPYQ